MAVSSIQTIIWMQNNKEVLYYHRRNPILRPRFLLTSEARLQQPNYDLSISIWLVKWHNLSAN